MDEQSRGSWGGAAGGTREVTRGLRLVGSGRAAGRTVQAESRARAHISDERASEQPKAPADLAHSFCRLAPWARLLLLFLCMYVCMYVPRCLVGPRLGTRTV